MKIKFKGFIIEEDRKSFILSEMDGETLKDQVYPSTLERCFMHIAHKCKKGSKAEIELKEAAVAIKEINDAFMKELREELSKLTIIGLT